MVMAMAMATHPLQLLCAGVAAATATATTTATVVAAPRAPTAATLTQALGGAQWHSRSATKIGHIAAKDEINKRLHEPQMIWLEIDAIHECINELLHSHSYS